MILPQREALTSQTSWGYFTSFNIFIHDLMWELRRSQSSEKQTTSLQWHKIRHHASTREESVPASAWINARLKHCSFDDIQCVAMVFVGREGPREEEEKRVREVFHDRDLLASRSSTTAAFVSRTGMSILSDGVRLVSIFNVLRTLGLCCAAHTFFTCASVERDDAHHRRKLSCAADTLVTVGFTERT